MVKVSNEAKVTITIIVAIVVAFIGFRAMRDMPLFRQSQLVYTYFERVDGLTAGNYIYINGVKVGSVSQINLITDDSVRVALSFNLGINLPKGSIAYLESSGLFNEKAVVIERGDSSENIEYGEVIQGMYRSGMMETLKEEGEKISGDVSQSFEELNTLLEQLNNTVTDENKARISGILSDLQNTTGEIDLLMQHKRKELESSIDHANRFFANLDTVSTSNKENIDSVLVTMNSSLKRIERLSEELEQTGNKMNEVLTKINDGEGSLGKLVNDPSLYNNLDSLSVEIKSLIKNINEDPSKYLRHMRLIEVF